MAVTEEPSSFVVSIVLGVTDDATPFFRLVDTHRSSDGEFGGGEFFCLTFIDGDVLFIFKDQIPLSVKLGGLGCFESRLMFFIGAEREISKTWERKKEKG